MKAALSVKRGDGAEVLGTATSMTSKGRGRCRGGVVAVLPNGRVWLQVYKGALQFQARSLCRRRPCFPFSRCPALISALFTALCTSLQAPLLLSSYLIQATSTRVILHVTLLERVPK